MYAGRRRPAAPGGGCQPAPARVAFAEMEPRSRRLVSPRPYELVIDIGLALLLTAFLFLVTSLQLHGQEGRPLDVPAWLLLAGAGLALALRRWLPLPAYALSLGFTAAYLASGHPPGPVVIAPFAALLTVIASSQLRVWLPAAAAGGAGLALVHGLIGGWSTATLLFAGIWTLVAVLFGAGLEAHRRYQAEMLAGARWAERSQAEEARRRLAEERLRIAREVHDVVGHSLAVISLQAGSPSTCSRVERKVGPRPLRRGRPPPSRRRCVTPSGPSGR